jgi:hypothetical protein
VSAKLGFLSASKLVGCGVVIVLVWGWVLPTIGSHTSVRESITRTDRLGINPAAIFYTDVFQSRTPAAVTDLLTRDNNE